MIHINPGLAHWKGLSCLALYFGASSILAAAREKSETVAVWG